MNRTERRLLFKGLFLVFLVDFIVQNIPFKYYYRFLKFKSDKSTQIIDGKKKIITITKTLSRIENLYPTKFSCLVKSITYKLLLKNQGIYSQLVLGITKNKRSEAHAYIKLDSDVIYLNNHMVELIYI